MLLKLSPEARKSYFKILTLDEFKRAAKASHINNAIFIKKTGKTYERLTKQELTSYVEKHWEDADDPIVPIYIVATNSAISRKFKKYNDLRNLTKGKSLSELTEEDKKKIESYRQEYESTGLELSYDDLITLNCKLDAEEEKEKETQRQKQILAQLKKDLEKAQKDNKQLNSENENLKKEAKKADKEIKGLKEKINSQQQDFNNYKKQFSVKNLDLKISDVLETKTINASTYEELYQELADAEKDALNTKEYNELLKILAAKFAVVKVMKGNDNDIPK